MTWLMNVSEINILKRKTLDDSMILKVWKQG